MDFGSKYVYRYDHSDEESVSDDSDFDNSSSKQGPLQPLGSVVAAAGYDCDSLDVASSSDDEDVYQPGSSEIIQSAGGFGDFIARVKSKGELPLIIITRQYSTRVFENRISQVSFLFCCKLNAC